MTVFHSCSGLRPDYIRGELIHYKHIIERLVTRVDRALHYLLHPTFFPGDFLMNIYPIYTIGAASSFMKIVFVQKVLYKKLIPN